MKQKRSARTDTANNLSVKRPLLPGISSFYSYADVENPPLYESSSDDEQQQEFVKRKKKLSRAERVELIKKRNDEILKKENELANLTEPKNSEHFERLLLADPNNSEMWIRYIAFHVASTEINKARTVAKKALETINVTRIEDKFKVWVALLNLENMFGTKESFESVFQDAVKYNDALQIYLKGIQMLAEAGKYEEMEQKVKKVRGKFKQELHMWLDLAKIYYQLNKFKEARNCKEGALRSILDKKTQINIIVRFAIMEFKHGEPEQGCAIFETILTTDPRRVNIWCTYVDQLVKKGDIPQARQVLDRAVSQKLPLKCMKTLFMKFRKFEESYGTEVSVGAIKVRAAAYIASIK
ncbi:protein RRP5 homolog [Cylas formicarius]|uniref:protein RRP5 homolog n=1 Tax=Cylas formicarius TaxID=197179 RepID=UPI0029589DA1|nr:protein RRP5 homolog [Cylas formicarius]